jgi:hypothetical protein
LVLTETESVSGEPKFDDWLVELPVMTGVARTTVVESVVDFNSMLPTLSVEILLNE